MTSAYEQLDEILGVSFGDKDPGSDAVLVDFQIRANATANGREVTRGNVLLHMDVLEALIAGLPGVIEAMREDGADRDVLPPPVLPVPEWNAGPRWNPAGATIHICTLFGARALVPELGAAVMVIQVTTPGRHVSSRESDSADYLMGWSSLLAFQSALPKVLRRLERVSTTTRRRH